MSFSEVDRRLKKDEQRTNRRELGRWHYLDGGVSITSGSSSRGGEIIALSRPKDSAKVTHYGFDGVVLLSVAGTTARAFTGAIVTYTLRPGQESADFFLGGAVTFVLPVGPTAGNNLARYAKYIPIAISGDSEATHGSLVLPFRVLFPREFVLKPEESYVVAMSTNDAEPTGTINARWNGRYRYIEGTA